MPIELKVPPVGESITEVQIGDWLKAEGENVSRDEIIVKIETDKVTVDLPAPATGTITQIKVKKGAVAQVGDVIGYMEEGAGAVAAKAPSRSARSPLRCRRRRSLRLPQRLRLPTRPPRRRRARPCRRRALLASCRPRVAR